MKRLGHPFLSLAAPFLILLALFGLSQRKSNERLQSLPSLIVGSGLIISGALGRRKRRNHLLMALRRKNQEEI